MSSRDHGKRAALVAQGFDPDAEHTRRARAATCRKCGAVVMRGIADDCVTWQTDCDPTPLSPLGEALALLAGRTTLTLRWTGSRYELSDNRDVFRIPAEPAGTVAGNDVLIKHECNSPIYFPGIVSRVDELKRPYIAGNLPVDAPF